MYKIIHNGFESDKYLVSGTRCVIVSASSLPRNHTDRRRRPRSPDEHALFVHQPHSHTIIVICISPNHDAHIVLYQIK